MVERIAVLTDQIHVVVRVERDDADRAVLEADLPVDVLAARRVHDLVLLDAYPCVLVYRAGRQRRPRIRSIVHQELPRRSRSPWSSNDDIASWSGRIAYDLAAPARNGDGHHFGAPPHSPGAKRSVFPACVTFRSANGRHHDGTTP